MAVSVIARRLEGGWVQYGWCGDDGEFTWLGLRLLCWYNDPELVEYLFDLGQLKFLWEPKSEYWNGTIRTHPTGRPHWLGKSETEMFSKDPENDVGYFYDLDNTWYYIYYNHFCVKIPLDLLANCIEPDKDGRYEEDDLKREVDRLLMDTIRDRYDADEDFRAYLAGLEYDPHDREAFMQAMESMIQEQRTHIPLRTLPQLLWEHHRSILNYFDPWAVVVPEGDNEGIRSILLRKKEAHREETPNWIRGQDEEA